MKKLKNLSFTFLGNASLAFSKWVILILIVKITNTEEVGRYTFSIALTSPLLLLINMRLRTRYVVEDNLKFKDLKKIRLLLSLLILLLIAIFGFIAYRDLMIYMILISLIRIMEMQSDLYYAIYHRISDFQRIGKIQFFRSMITILVFALTIFITRDVKIALMSQLVFHVIWLFGIERKSKLLIKEEYTTNILTLWAIFLAGVPLAFVQLINSYNIYIPRYFIEGVLSIELVGIFAAISYLLTIVDLFMNAMSQNIILDLKEYISKNQFKQLKKFILIKMPVISLILIIVLPMMIFIVGEDIINIIYGSEYSKYYLVLVIISISISFNFLSWMYDTTLMALKIYKSQIYISILTFLVSLTTSYYLINGFGIYGAAFSIVIINFSQMIFKFILAFYFIRKKESNCEDCIYT